MAFSQVTVTHTFENADGTPASGQITFALTKRMTNGAITIVPAEITAALDSSGNLSQALTANNDVGTLPTDSTWMVTLRIQGAPAEAFSIVVPAGAGVDLGTLMSQDALGG